ncbi:MAG: hypothetical protein K2M47_06720 [Clostridiales bacterium]|nr:hypothetical protein [Clostridiales bacterium]
MTNAKRLKIINHFICMAITLGILLLGVFVFSNALGRLIESIRDLGYSIGYFFAELFGIEHTITPTVNEFAKIPFFDFSISSDTPSTSLPDTWSGFQSSWGAYWRLWATADNFTGYISFLGDILFYVCMAVLVIMPFALLLYLYLGRYTKQQNNDYDIDSKPLRAFKWLTAHTYIPIRNFIYQLVDFVKEHKRYYGIWIFLLLLYANVFTIVIEFIAFYFYFVISFDLSGIYRQVYKLFVDLAVPFSVIPVWLWVIIAYLILSYISKKIAYNRLYHNELMNRGFINERGVVTIVYGAMGVGKTTQITDMALSTEIQFRDTAFEIILETDMQFPYFPWCNLENELKCALNYHVVYDIHSCRRWVRKKAKRWKKYRCRQKIFDYDYERYGLQYDDKLKLIDIWSAIEDYACAYLIYTVQSSLLISNYSIRSDNLMSDLGNFPLWNTDFFKRDSRLIDSYSRHAHILDFDMLRLGKQMLKDNPNRNALGFGVYIVSEIDKERKNTPELKDKKIDATADDCNQKNDLFNILLKMIRHACVVANKVFVKVFADLQRPSSLGADALELGEVVDIVSAGDMFPTLPFFSPFWLFDLLFSFLKSKFDNFYISYRYVRADNTLLLYLFKSITAKLTHYHDGMYNLFGSQTLALQVERGSREGEFMSRKYYRMPKKIYSKRYATDCLSGIFENRAAANYVGIDDLAEYADIMATPVELAAQNSHFQKEIKTLNSADA